MYFKKYFRQKTLFIFLAIIFLAISSGIFLTFYEKLSDSEMAEATYFNMGAGTGDNCSGFAWSPNFGWISFNSSDCDLNGDGIFGDAGAPTGCPNSSVTFHDYGVNIETGTGIINGFAWSQNLGWIYFGPDANLGAYGNINAADAPEDPKQWATYDFSSNQVNGWALALSLGTNGWIKMTGTWTNGVKIDPNNFEFSGFAWNGNDTGNSIGWISFNCKDIPKICLGGLYPGTFCNTSDTCGGGNCLDTCSVTNYKVTGITNQKPEAKELQAPFLSNDQLCSLGVRSSILKWEFSDSDAGAYETAYQIIFDDDNDPSDPLLETPKCNLYTNHVDCLVAPGVDQYPIHETAVNLEYGKHYYWWVKVWDNLDVESDWAGSTNWGADFNVPGHEYPEAYIDNYEPMMPNAGVEVTFAGHSLYYDYGAPGISKTCENDGALCSWRWEVSPNNYFTINDVATTSPKMTFDNSEQMYEVRLKVTDSEGFYCLSEPVIMNPNIDLPKWIEVKGNVKKN